MTGEGARYGSGVVKERLQKGVAFACQAEVPVVRMVGAAVLLLRRQRVCRLSLVAAPNSLLEWARVWQVVGIVVDNNPVVSCTHASCRSYEDVYGDPGTPLVRRTKTGTYILAKVGSRLHTFAHVCGTLSVSLTAPL